jgi:hypothetical protein
MSLDKKELEVLNKILEKIIEPYSREDLASMIQGPKYKDKIDWLYDNCFRPHLKYGASVLGGEMDDREQEILEAMWIKVSEYLFEE